MKDELGPQLNVNLRDLKERQCRWPDGNIQTKMTFCGRDSVKDNSYCPEHKARSVRKTRKR